jgi:hypothetical protein
MLYICEREELEAKHLQEMNDVKKLNETNKSTIQYLRKEVKLAYC